MSAFENLTSLDVHRIWDGVHARVVHGQRLTLGVIELDPNSVVPEHSHEHEQLGMCLSGSLTFRVADESRELGPGGTWCIPGNVPHEVHVGPDGAVVVDVFAPTRDDWYQAPRLGQRPVVRWP
jgi:quercetin dioxygenase-like cupin family protein